MEIREMITEIKGRLDTRGGLKAVIFVACGGSQAAIYPGKYLLEREANEIAVSIYNSNEFNYVTPKSLDERCIVICCSLKATAETVHAVERARQFGAVTIAMTGSPETGMAKAGEYVVVYSNGDEQIYSQSNQSMALRLGFEILHQFEGYPLYHEAMAAFDQIDAILQKANDPCSLPHNLLLLNIKTILSFKSWGPARCTGPPILWQTVILWKCIGEMPL